MQTARRRNPHGHFTHQAASRLSRDRLLQRVSLLPTLQRTLLRAHLDLGMCPADLAAIRGMPAAHLRRQLRLLRDRLEDPAFLLAAQFAPALDPEFCNLATRYWVEAATLRDLAAETDQTIHAIRQKLQTVRAMLVLHARDETHCDAATAGTLLMEKLSTRKIA